MVRRLHRGEQQEPVATLVVHLETPICPGVIETTTAPCFPAVSTHQGLVHTLSFLPLGQHQVLPGIIFSPRLGIPMTMHCKMVLGQIWYIADCWKLCNLEGS